MRPLSLGSNRYEHHAQKSELFDEFGRRDVAVLKDQPDAQLKTALSMLRGERRPIAYSGDRDHSFRLNVTVAHEMVLRD